MYSGKPLYIVVSYNLLDLPNSKSLLSEHVAERALIVGNTQGCLYQQTVGFL